MESSTNPLSNTWSTLGWICISHANNIPHYAGTKQYCNICGPGPLWFHEDRFFWISVSKSTDLVNKLNMLDKEIYNLTHNPEKYNICNTIIPSNNLWQTLGWFCYRKELDSIHYAGTGPKCTVCGTYQRVASWISTSCSSEAMSLIKHKLNKIDALKKGPVYKLYLENKELCYKIYDLQMDNIKLNKLNYYTEQSYEQLQHDYKLLENKVVNIDGENKSLTFYYDLVNKESNNKITDLEYQLNELEEYNLMREKELDEKNSEYEKLNKKLYDIQNKLK